MTERLPYADDTDQPEPAGPLAPTDDAPANGWCHLCGKREAMRPRHPDGRPDRPCGVCEGEMNTVRHNRLGDVIRELRASRGTPPDRERHLVKQLRELGHPDVDGLLAAIAAKREAEPVPKRAKSRDGF